MKNVLIPNLRPYIIYDNYASLKNRGTSFARKRFEIMLKKYMLNYGNNGYILIIDIKKYFENIDHKILKQLITPKLKNYSKNIIDLIYYIIDNSSHYSKGLNLGSEIPQILAIYYLNPLDTYLKIVKSTKYYGRYMDDIFIIEHSKEKLILLLKEIENILSLLKLQTNKKKTQIIKLSKGFTFLQIKYNITKNNKIIKRLPRNKITRERKRLKSFKKLLDLNKITLNEIYNCYLSWRGTIIKEYNACYKTICNLDKLYNILFSNSKPKIKNKKLDISIDTKILIKLNHDY